MLQWKKVVKKVFVEAWHGLCTFHIMQNAVKHLAEGDDEESNTSPKQTTEENDKEPSIIADFSVSVPCSRDTHSYCNKAGLA